MAHKRTYCQLDEIAYLRNGAGIKQSSFAEEGIPIVRVSDFTENSIDISQCIFLRKEEIDIWKSFLLEIDEILVATVGSWGTSATSAVGKVVRVPETASNCIQNQNTCSIKAISGIASQRWIYYALKHTRFKHFVDSVAAGSANQARLAVKNLSKYKLLVPPLSDQKKIANMLGVLDDKIQLNKQMNENLEEIAKTLFKSWFIDFDPVRAKTEGRPTGLSKEISDLFPDSLEDSELGEIPRGWKIKKVGECLEFIYGKGLTKKQRIHGDIPVYGSNGIIGFHNSSNAKGPGIVVGRAGNPGTVHWSFKDFFAIDSAFSVNVIDEEMSNFYFYALKNLRLERLNSGSAIPGLNRNHAYEEKIIIPNLPLLREFNKLSSSFFSKQLLNLEENEVLSQLRDKLLPRLISGELQIPDAENLVEEAGI